jgi:ribosomal protein S18 acetylase RimI-like enzyme
MEHATRSEIRKLDVSDAGAYRELRLRALVESSASFSDSAEDEKDQPLDWFANQMGTQPEHFTVGAFADGHLAGFAIFKRDARRKARHKSMIHTMYVAPEARRQGVAEKLLAFLLKEARAMPGLEQVHLWVLGVAPSPASRLYEKLGFRFTGPAVPDDLRVNGGSVPASYMVLLLP